MNLARRHALKGHRVLSLDVSVSMHTVTSPLVFMYDPLHHSLASTATPISHTKPLPGRAQSSKRRESAQRAVTTSLRSISSPTQSLSERFHSHDRISSHLLASVHTSADESRTCPFRLLLQEQRRIDHALSVLEFLNRLRILAVARPFAFLHSPAKSCI